MWATKKDATEILDCYGDVSWWPVGGRQKAAGEEGNKATPDDEQAVMREESFREKLNAVRDW